MVASVREGGKYFLVGLIGALLIGNVLGSPLPQQYDGSSEWWESSNEIDAGTVLSNQPATSVGSTTIKQVTDSISTTTEQLITSSSTTTEHPHAAIARIYSSPQDKVANMQYASGVHKFRVGHNEDENKRAIEEYNYHFVRREMNLPPTTKRFNMSPPSKY